MDRPAQIWPIGQPNHTARPALPIVFGSSYPLGWTDSKPYLSPAKYNLIDRFSHLSPLANLAIYYFSFSFSYFYWYANCCAWWMKTLMKKKEILKLSFFAISPNRHSFLLPSWFWVCRFLILEFVSLLSFLIGLGSNDNKHHPSHPMIFFPLSLDFPSLISLSWIIPSLLFVNRFFFSSIACCHTEKPLASPLWLSMPWRSAAT